MKKITALFLCITVLFSLSACAKKENNQSVSSSGVSNTASAESSGVSSQQSAEMRPAAENKSDTLGELFIVNQNDDFRLNGIILVGGSHIEEYGKDFTTEELDFSTKGFYKDFYLDEFVGIYMDGQYLDNYKNYAEIFITKHNENIANMTASEIKEKAVSFSGELLDITASKISLALEFNVKSEKNTPGLYDIVFTAGDKICYCTTVNITQR